MEKETLEESAERYAKKVFNERPNLDNNSKIWLVGGSTEGFIEGAKWQQERSYSEEEVLEITKKLHTEIGIQFSHEIKLWVIKQFKKK
jgi:hypothetical protein